MLARGYRRIGYLGGPEQASSTQDRLAGFRDALTQDRLTDVRFAAAYSFAAGRREMIEALQASPADAYFCGDDVLSVGAVSAIHDRGLTVPGDIGILGFNDMEIAGWNNIELTTIRQPIPEIVAAAIDRMVSILSEDGAGAPADQLFPCDVIERGTLRRAGQI